MTARPGRPKAAKPAPQTTPKPAKPIDDTPPWEEERPPLPEEPPIREDLPPWDVPAPPAKRETPPPAAPVREPVRPPEAPPVRESAPARPAPPARDSSGFAPAIRPAESPAEAAPAVSASSGELWLQLSEGCKGQLPPMYRAFLDLCRGTVSRGVVQVYAPDDITKGRLDNDRVLGVLRAQGESLTGGPVQVRLTVGTSPAVTPDQRRDMLIQFGSQFDAVRIED